MAVLFMVSCQSENPTEPNGNGSDKIDIGESVTVATQQVSSGGGVVQVSSVDTLISGLQITIPPNSYPDARTFTVSYAPVQSHKFGEFFKPISPLITISNGGGYADTLMEVKIPISLHAGMQPVAFFFDDRNGKLEPIPMLTYDSKSVTIATMHFDVTGISAGVTGSKGVRPSDLVSFLSRVIITEISDEMVQAIAASHPVLGTGFNAGTDDWEFVNHGSYLPDAQGGHCAGQNISSLWYFFEKKMALGERGLFHRYDSVNTSSDVLWEDNRLGYRMASATQINMDWDTKMRRFFREEVGAQDNWTWNALAVSMFLNNEPYIMSVRGKDAAGNSVGHSLIAYAVNLTTRSIAIADPNFPGNQTRRITYDGRIFAPYNSALTAGDPNIAFDTIRLNYKTTTIDWAKVGELWNNVMVSKQNPGFPDYTLWVNTTPSVKLEEYYSTSVDTVDISLVSTDPNNIAFRVYDKAGVRIIPIAPATITKRGVLHLQPGDNTFGFYILGEPTTNRWRWVDFRWIHITYNQTSVSIQPPITVGAKNQQYVWSGIAKNRPNNVRYEWDFGDGSAKFIRNNDSVAYYSYSNDGEYTIKLQVFDRSTNKMIGEATATASIHSGPEIISVVPQEVSYGATVYISGKGFGATQGTNTLKFGAGLAPKSIISWRDDEIVATVPEMFEAVNNYVTVTVNGIESNRGLLNCMWPEITSVSPDSCEAGEIVAIKGKWFGHMQGNSKIEFGLTDVGTIVTWSDTMITIIVPEPAAQMYSFNYINFTRGNGSTTSHKFAIIENVLNTLQRTTCFSGLVFSGNFKMSISSPTPHEEYQNTMITIESNGCQISKMVWDNRDFSVTISAIAQYDTNITTFNGTVSFDGKTLETINARYYQGTKNSTNIRELHFKNIPLKTSYPYYNRVTFELSGAELKDHFVKAVVDYTSPVYITKYIETDWSHATIIPRFSVTLYKP